MTDKYHFRIVWALAAVAALLLSCEPNSVTGEEPEPGVPEVPVEQEWSLELGKVTSYSAELIMETAAVAEHDVKILYTETASSDPLAAGTAYISGEGSHWTAELRGLSASTRYVAGLYIDNELDHPIKMLNFLTPEEDALVTGTELSSEGNSLLISGNVLDLSAGISKSVQYGIAYNSDVDPMGNGGPLVLSGNLSDKSYSVLLEGLAPGVLYYYRAWANIDGGIHYGGLQTFTVLLTVDESEAVDLGLSVLWSGRNLGTESPAQYLDHYYAWGETEWHTGSYDWMVHKDKDYNKMPLSISGNAEYDAATAALGSGWRIPTAAECEELLEKCETRFVQSFTDSKEMSCPGFIVTGPSGKSIFIPAAGLKVPETGTSLYGSNAYLWSADVYMDADNCHDKARCLDFWKDGEPSVATVLRFCGLPVRPVKDKSAE